MKLISHEVILDKHVGPAGTPQRQSFDEQVELQAVGAKVREMRESSGLTQAQLAERLGIGRAQISKIETDMKDLKLSTVQRVFRALGARARLVVD